MYADLNNNLEIFSDYYETKLNSSLIFPSYVNGVNLWTRQNYWSSELKSH